MAGLVGQALQENAEPKDVATAAVKEAIAGADSEAEKEALALSLYKEATGRFPQDSSDRKAVYVGGFLLVGIIVLLVLVALIIVLLKDKTMPDALWVLATAVTSGVLGGLFGYAKQ